MHLDVRETSAAASSPSSLALRAPSVRADTAPFTLFDLTMPPTSFDIGFSLNPCPRKPGAPYEQLSGQVTCLDADYRTLAATLRARWN